ncbi:aspartyl/asparaginyl beta-hydroxylase domain-containing protein [Bordetella bronchiseptica]|nr:aspartyl/asparaginyl beta-hydroxylase domain-containing protein [Bordetella bronchiseptica]WLS59012.1 aspartyl/asparaginyl beta-hydroxylase domain-containing protein [Bordetella bronchiseptica]WLS63846.1 aspartyl/asparaginyl beta-hydroxylase domain-containing protein [Bordetella bronchiseptica]
MQRGPYNGVLRLHLALIVPQMPGSAGAMDQNRATSVRRLPRPRPWALD